MVSHIQSASLTGLVTSVLLFQEFRGRPGSPSQGQPPPHPSRCLGPQAAAHCPGPVPRIRVISPCIWYLHLTCRATLAARQTAFPGCQTVSTAPHASSDRRRRATNGPHGFCVGTPESEDFLCWSETSLNGLGLPPSAHPVLCYVPVQSVQPRATLSTRACLARCDEL